MRTALDIIRSAQSEHRPVLRPYVRADGITLLVGPEGSGKSTLLSHIAVAVASGENPPWALGVRQGPVLWLTGEETDGNVAWGVEGTGASDEVLGRLQVESVTEPDIPRLLALVREHQPALVIADPVDVFAPPRFEPRRTLEPLLADLRAKGYGVIAVVHTLHGARVGQKLVKGAGDWTRLARSVLYYGPDPRPDPLDPTPRSILYHYKSNRGGERGQTQEFSLADGWLGSIPDMDLHELLQKPEKRPAAPRPLARAISMLTDLLADGAAPTSMVLARAIEERISRATVYRAAQVLGIDRADMASENGHFAEKLWSLPGSSAKNPIESSYSAADEFNVGDGDDRDDGLDVVGG